MTSRLAALGTSRLARPGPDGVRPLERVRPLLQHLADLAADAEGRSRREVPDLAPQALADQLIVLVRDVLQAPGTTDREARLDDVHDRLVGLRRCL